MEMDLTEILELEGVVSRERFFLIRRRNIEVINFVLHIF